MVKKRPKSTRIEKKLGTRLASKGWEPIPGVLIRYWHKIRARVEGVELRLNPRDVLLLQFLIMNRRQKVGVREMSYVLNINERNTRKILRKLKDMGLITYDDSPGRKRSYGLGGLIGALESLANEYSSSARLRRSPSKADKK